MSQDVVPEVKAMLRLCEEYLSSIPMCMLVAEIERRKTQESTPEDDMGWKVQAKPNEGIQAAKDEGAKADKDEGAEEKRVECAGAKKRKHDPWVGWKVARQGKWDGYELINCGGNMEWLQARINPNFALPLTVSFLFLAPHFAWHFAILFLTLGFFLRLDS